jgi:hypothetical protein
LIGQELGGAAGGDQAHAQGVELLSEFDDAGFVRDGDECAHGGVVGQKKKGMVS